MLNKVFKKQDDIVSREIAGESILVPIRGKLADMQRIFSLDPVAEYIWRQLDGRRTLNEVSSGVLETFDVKKEQAEADLMEFIDELLAAELIAEVE